MHAIQLKIKIFSDDDVISFAKLSADEYPNSSLVEKNFINWKHGSSPVGKSTHLQIFSDGQQIGRILVQPRTLLTSQHDYKAGCMADLLVISCARKTPSHFLRLNNACNSLSGFDFLYHTSNDRSFPLYSKLLKYKYSVILRGYGIPIRIGGVLKSMTGLNFKILSFLSKIVYQILQNLSKLLMRLCDVNIVSGLMTDAELKKLLSKCMLNGDPFFERTPNYLRWKSMDNPAYPSQIYQIFKNKKFTGYFILGNVPLNGMTHAVLHDFFVDSNLSYMTKVSLRVWLVIKAYIGNADTLFTMANEFSTQTKNFLGFPLMKIPNRFLPHFTPIFVRPMSAQGISELMKSAHITLVDLDYF